MPQGPGWHMHHKDEKPKTDNEYFEKMSRVVFMAGLNWRVMDKKWPGLKKAFADFDIKKVASFQEMEVEELMNNPDVIHNLPKIRAVIANAKEFQQIIKEHGSFANYLAELSKAGEDQMRATISKRFAFMGKGTTVIFLFATGEDLPKAKAEWEARHAQS